MRESNNISNMRFSVDIILEEGTPKERQHFMGWNGRYQVKDLLELVDRYQLFILREFMYRDH